MDSGLNQIGRPFLNTAMHIPREVKRGAEGAVDWALNLPLRVAKNILTISTRTALRIALNVPLLPMSIAARGETSVGSNATSAEVKQKVEQVAKEANERVTNLRMAA